MVRYFVEYLLLSVYFMVSHDSNEVIDGAEAQTCYFLLITSNLVFVAVVC